MIRQHTLAATAMLVASLALPVSPARAATADGGVPGGWLMNYAGARTLGMGGAFVATADDALGALWNPAGLPWMDQNQVMFENVGLYEGTSINSLSFAVPGSRFPSLGVTALSLHSGDFERTNELNDNLGTFHEGETAYLFTVAKAITPRLALGTNVKVVQQTIENFSAGGFGMDVGAILQLTSALRVGVSGFNLGGPKVTLRSTEEAFPTQMRAGLSLGVMGGRGQIVTEVDHVNGVSAQLHAGTEYWIQPTVGLRVGVDGDGPTGGLSYRFGQQYQFDYGVADHPLGLSHRIGLSLRFGGFFASSDAQPAVFSPTGEHSSTQVRLNAHTKAEADTWSLEFTDKTRQVVRRFGGAGLPPPHVQWDGKDESGLPVADGQYSYRLIVKDHAGRVLSSSDRRVEITTTGPQGEVPVSTTAPSNP